MAKQPGRRPLRVRLPAQTDKPARVTVRRIVVRPVDDGWTPWIVNEFAAYFDAVADLHRTSRRNIDVIDYFNRPRLASRVKSFVHAVRARSIEKTGRRENRRFEIDLRRRRAHIGRREIHHAALSRTRACATRAREGQREGMRGL
jgi:hypothetical protein